MRLVEHITVTKQAVKSRLLAGLIEKIAHFLIGNLIVFILISGWTLIKLLDLSVVRSRMSVVKNPETDSDAYSDFS